MNSPALEKARGEQPNQNDILGSLLRLPPSLLGPSQDIRERFDRLTKHILTPEDRENVDAKMNDELIKKIQQTLAEYQLRVTALEQQHSGYISDIMAGTPQGQELQSAA